MSVGVLVVLVCWGWLGLLIVDGLRRERWLGWR